MNELTIGDKIYISSKRAAEITGYAKDYIGQLCREGRVEATLVGRSWYVLETSIRAHRFGSEDVKADKAVSSPDPIPTWEPPKYEVEDATTVPVLERRSINLLDGRQELSSKAADEPIVEPVTSSVEDMQSAWREWFATRQQESASSGSSSQEEISRAETQIEDPYEVSPVILHRVEEEKSVLKDEEPAPEYDPVPFTDEIEEDVPMRRTYESMRPASPEIRLVGGTPRSERRAIAPAAKNARRPVAGKSSLSLRAAFVAVAVLAVVIAVIGSGIADAYVRNAGVESSMIRFFAGTVIIE
ncbi:MAG TPA: hypothetical protein VEA92_02730 [Candidatus Paceibacterota bacterium]|nr:hypothetical protein [Candidatus Paceibacterota bacterium]